MKIAYVKGKTTTIVLDDEELAVAYHFIVGVIQNCGGRTPQDLLRLHAIGADMEHEINRRKKAKEEAERYHICLKCFTEIDTRVDKYIHRTDDGSQSWIHQECPLINPHE